MFRIFISYATEDESFALRLSNDLQRLGAPTWLAQQSIRPGEGWVSAIERGLRGSSHMAVVLTPAAAASPWVQKEIEVAISRERSGQMQLIPLSVESCDAPLLLQSYQWVSFRRGYEAGLSRLAGVLGLQATQAPRTASAPRRFGSVLGDAQPLGNRAPARSQGAARGPALQQAKIGVRIDPDECISCGVCWEECPSVFEENPEDEMTRIAARYRVRNDPGEGAVPPELEECVRNAAEVCPMEIIHVS